jgi:hypothetical protein
MKVVNTFLTRILLRGNFSELGARARLRNIDTPIQNGAKTPILFLVIAHWN